MENLTNKLRQFRDDRNWQKFHIPKDLAISVSVEAAELLELFQWRDNSKPVNEEFIQNARNEAADVFLYRARTDGTEGMSGNKWACPVTGGFEAFCLGAERSHRKSVRNFIWHKAEGATTLSKWPSKNAE
ncbi:MAG: hypothetical protein ABJQ71_23170 [Roseibium sp.]